MKTKSELYLSVIILFCTVFGCTETVDKEVLLTHHWKMQEGYHIGDLIFFWDGYFEVRDSFKLYKKNKYVGRVVSCDKKYLIIKDTSNLEFGRYVILY